jgi:hypothetical protein
MAQFSEVTPGAISRKGKYKKRHVEFWGGQSCCVTFNCEPIPRQTRGGPMAAVDSIYPALRQAHTPATGLKILIRLVILTGHFGDIHAIAAIILVGWLDMFCVFLILCTGSAPSSSTD